MVTIGSVVSRSLDVKLLIDNTRRTTHNERERPLAIYHHGNSGGLN